MHKDTHGAVVIDCWMNKLGEVNFENRPSRWENYPSPEYIWNTTPEEIYQTIKPVHQALKIQRIHEIISMIERDGDTRKDYQPERDFIVRNIVKDIRHNKELIAEIDDELR